LKKELFFDFLVFDQKRTFFGICPKKIWSNAQKRIWAFARKKIWSNARKIIWSFAQKIEIPISIFRAFDRKNKFDIGDNP